MAGTAKAIRFDEVEQEMIQGYADLQGVSFSQAVRDAIMDVVEDYYDIKAYEDYLASKDKQPIAWDDAARMLHFS